MEENKDLEVVTEEVKEEATEEVKEVEEVTEETTEEVKEEETTEEVVEEATEETTEEVKEEVAEEPSVEETEEISEEPKKKSKKKLDTVNIIVIVVCAVIVLACIAFLGIKLNWFSFLQTGKITLPDYSTIEVINQQVETSDELVDQYIDQLLSITSTQEQVKEGYVVDGDIVNIDYVGKLAETGVAFEGGTASGYDLTIGSGSFIPGFEDQLKGAAIGTKKTINVTFPAEYQNTELAGKAATFDVTINYKTITVTPELTDEWVKENGSHFIEGEFKSVADFKAAMKEYVYKIQLHAAMFEDIHSKQTIEAYNENDKKELKEYLMKKLAEEAAYYNYEVDDLAKMFGAESADAYATSQAESYLDVMMPVDKIFKQEHLKVTDEQVDKYLQRYMYQQGIADKYTLDQVKELQGKTWLKLYTTLEVKYDILMNALEKNVKFIDAADPEASTEVPTEATTN